MPRDKKGIIRKSGGQSKDPTKYFVIASEGTETEPGYFEMIAEYVTKLSIGRLVKIEPLRRADTDSSFRRVIQQLDEYKRSYMLKTSDEMWCLIDRDRIPPANIAEADQLCRQKGYYFCLTSPCFELWLLLHLKDLTDFSQQEQLDILANRKTGNRTYIERKLSELCMDAFGLAYHKNNPPAALLQHIPAAISRSFNHLLDDKHWTHADFCTLIHLLVQRIFDAQGPDYHIPMR